MLKRYLVFAGPRHYPGGGPHDLRGSTDTADEALALATQVQKALVREWLHAWWAVLDTHTGLKCGVWADGTPTGWGPAIEP